MSSETNDVYTFGPFRLDLKEHRLERADGRPVGPLPEKAFSTLALLVRNQGHLMSKQELLDQVWPDSFVEPNNVDKCVYAIRTVLGERPGDQKYIETVRKRGYRFVANVGTVAADEHQSTAQPSQKERSRQRWLTFALVGLLIGIAIVGVVIAKYWPTPQRQPALPSIIQKRLTTEGGATRAAISRDGKYAAVVQNAALTLFDLEGGQKTLLVPADPKTRIVTVTFTPDNSSIFYGTRPINSTVVTLFSRSIKEESDATEVLSDLYGSVSFSPDGNKFAFVRRYPELNEFALLTADADGKNISKLASSPLPNYFEGAPAWSPDGTVVAVPAISVEGGFHHAIMLIDVVSGEMTSVPDQRWAALTALSWLTDSRNMIISAKGENTSDLQVWRVDTATGDTTRVTNDDFAYETISAAPEGGRILAVKVRDSSHVWLMGERQTQLTSGFDSKDGANGLGWLPDGQILYHSIVSGREAIWRMNSDGSGASHVVDDTKGGFSVSRDGRWLVFQDKQETDHLGLKAISLLDGVTRDLTYGVTAAKPSFFPDGRRIAFSQFIGKLTLHETTVDGGPPNTLSADFHSVHSTAVSPSGRLIAFAFQRAENQGLENGIAILDYATKRIIATYIVGIPIGGRYEEPTIGWAADESEVYFIQLIKTSVSNVMRLRLDDGTVSNVTNFVDGRVFNFSVEPGGTRILIARGLVERDATLLQIND